MVVKVGIMVSCVTSPCREIYFLHFQDILVQYINVGATNDKRPAALRTEKMATSRN